MLVLFVRFEGVITVATADIYPLPMSRRPAERAERGEPVPPLETGPLVPSGAAGRATS